ncbi:MAG TPA: hypothetical protein VF331_24610, partial [Polyangiales bacterium]
MLWAGVTTLGSVITLVGVMLLAMRERGGSHERFSLAWFRRHKLELVVALGSAAAAVGGFIGS